MEWAGKQGSCRLAAPSISVPEGSLERTRKKSGASDFGRRVLPGGCGQGQTTTLSKKSPRPHLADRWCGPAVAVPLQRRVCNCRAVSGVAHIFGRLRAGGAQKQQAFDRRRARASWGWPVAAAGAGWAFLRRLPHFATLRLARTARGPLPAWCPQSVMMRRGCGPPVIESAAGGRVCPVFLRQ